MGLWKVEGQHKGLLIVERNAGSEGYMEANKQSQIYV